MLLIKKPFIFMRHGETQANQGNLFCGATDIPLNESGREQAIKARRVLKKLDISNLNVISSSMQRAQQTTQLALPDVNFVTNADLSERSWGEWEMTAITHSVSYFDTPPGGESWSAFIHRVTQALNNILLANEFPLIVAHSGVYRVIQFHATGSPNGARVPNATPVRFWPEADSWQQQIVQE